MQNQLRETEAQVAARRDELEDLVGRLGEGAQLEELQGRLTEGRRQVEMQEQQLETVKEKVAEEAAKMVE